MSDPYETLLDALDQHRGGSATVTFIEGGEGESVFSFGDLRRQALVTLAAFRSQGVGTGDEVILALSDNREMLIGFWACLYGGLVPVPLAIGATDEHRAKVFRIAERLAEPWLAVDERGWGRLEKFALKTATDESLEAVAARRLLLVEFSPDAPLAQPVDVAPKDLALIQFSSGSTRDPKGIRLTHENVVVNMLDFLERTDLTGEDVGLSWMPLTHDMGLIAMHLGFVVAGASHHILPTELFTRRPLLWLEKAAEKSATVLGSPNFGYKHYLQAYHSRGGGVDLDLSRVRLILNGAEPISVPLAREFIDTLEPLGLARTALQAVYGLAEATVGVAIPMPGRELAARRVDRRSLGVGDPVVPVEEGDENAIEIPLEGPPFRRCEVRLVDDEGRVLAERTVGHLEIRGPNVTDGFVADPEAEAARSAEGWLDTGDLAFLDQGEIAITGRAKDILFAFGQNLYPYDLEAVACEEDGVELGKVAVTGYRPAAGSRDRVLVFIQHRGKVADFAPLAARVAGRINQRLGVEVDEVLPVRRIPRTTSGKLQRQALAGMFSRGEFDETRDELARLSTVSTAADGETTGASEELVLEIAGEVLAERSISLDENLFESGLSSLDLAQIHERIDERHPGVLDIMDLFDHPTLRRLAAFLDDKIVAAGS